MERLQPDVLGQGDGEAERGTKSSYYNVAQYSVL